MLSLEHSIVYSVFLVSSKERKQTQENWWPSSSQYSFIFKIVILMQERYSATQKKERGKLGVMLFGCS